LVQATLCYVEAQLPYPKRGQRPNFRPIFIVDEDATWYGSRPRSRPLCLRRVPRYPRKRHNSPPPLFDTRLLWPRSPISTTAELLFVFYISLEGKISVLHYSYTAFEIRSETGCSLLQRAAMRALRRAVLAIAIPSVCPSVCLSVCPSVCHTTVLCQNDGT